jgi:hypothetical protein
LNNCLTEIAFQDLPEILQQDILSETSPDSTLYVTDSYDWQAYVPDELRSIWGQLPLTCKLVACIVARDRASMVDDPD